MRIALADRLRGKRYPRTQRAEQWFAGYALTGLVLVVASLPLKAAFPLALAGGLGAIQFGFDLKGKGHAWFPEMCGASALAFLACILALLGNASDATAWRSAGLMLAYALPTILYVAIRLRLARNQPTQVWPSWIAQLAALAMGWVLSPFSLLALVALATRSVWGLSPLRRNVPPMIVGVQEAAYALLAVLGFAIALRR